MNLEHEWDVPYAGRDANGHYIKCMTCKLCKGQRGTVIIRGREIALPTPGEECPIKIAQYIHES